MINLENYLFPEYIHNSLLGLARYFRADCKVSFVIERKIYKSRMVTLIKPVRTHSSHIEHLPVY